MAYELPPLPYDYIGARTLHRHRNHEAPPRQASPDLHQQRERRSGQPPRAGRQVRRRPVSAISPPSPKTFAALSATTAEATPTTRMFWTIMGPANSAGIGGTPPATSPSRSPPTSETSRPSRKPSTRPRPSSSAPAGAGWSSPAASSRSSPPPTRIRRCRRGFIPSSATTSGSTPTTSSTRTAVPTTSRPGGTSSIGPKSTSASPKPRDKSSS